MKRRTILLNAVTVPAARIMVGTGSLWWADSVMGQTSTVPASAGPRKPATSSSNLVTAGEGLRMAPELARIVERGELRVAMVKFDAKPFVYTDKGTIAGVDVQLIETVGRQLRVPVTYDRSARSFSDVIDLVAEGQVDIGAGKISRTVSRSMKVRFTDPYLLIRHALLANRQELVRMNAGAQNPDVFRDYRGRLGVLAGTAYQEFARINFESAIIEPYEKWQDALSAVKAGRLPLLYRDEFEIRAAMKADPSLALTAKAIVFKDLKAGISWAVQLADDNLRNFLDEVLALQRAKLNVDRLLKELDKV